MRPVVSVIIPTYGGNSSLVGAIDSVLCQSYNDFEIIVIDDNEPGSNGRSVTEAMMHNYEEDPRIVYIKHDHNKNGAAARNTGVSVAKGEYIAFLDDDDRFLPNKLQVQVKYLEDHTEYGAVYCWRYQNGKLISSDLEGDLSQEILDLTFTPYTSAIMMRISCYQGLNGFDENYRRHQDFEFLLRFFKKYKIGVIKEPLVEIVGNAVNNQLEGEQALALKKQFLSDFRDRITEIDCKSKGFKKRVWAAHYSDLAVRYTLKGHFLLLIKMYVQEGYKGGVIFWKNYFGRIWEIFKYQFEKRKR